MRARPVSASDLIKQQQISIHVPMRARRCPVRPILSTQRHFNPRAHEGTTVVGRLMYPRFDISIHVPMRARRRWSGLNYGTGEFQSTCP